MFDFGRFHPVNFFVAAVFCSLCPRVFVFSFVFNDQWARRRRAMMCVAVWRVCDEYVIIIVWPERQSASSLDHIDDGIITATHNIPRVCIPIQYIIVYSRRERWARARARVLCRVRKQDVRVSRAPRSKTSAADVFFFFNIIINIIWYIVIVVRARGANPNWWPPSSHPTTYCSGLTERRRRRDHPAIRCRRRVVICPPRNDYPWITCVCVCFCFRSTTTAAAAAAAAVVVSRRRRRPVPPSVPRRRGRGRPTPSPDQCRRRRPAAAERRRSLQ